MGSRDFERATPNRIGSPSTVMGTGLTTLGVTMAALVTVESYPAAAAVHMPLGGQAGTTTRQFGLGIWEVTGELFCTFGTTDCLFASTIPVNDGRWYLLAASKATGTVAPIGYMYDRANQTFTETTSGTTVANRVAGAVGMNVGSFGGGDYWDGRIAYVGVFEKILTRQQLIELAHYRNAWKNHNQNSRNGADIDLTWKHSTMGLCDKNPTIQFSSGTPPAFDGNHPPGF